MYKNSRPTVFSVRNGDEVAIRKWGSKVSKLMLLRVTDCPLNLRSAACDCCVPETCLAAMGDMPLYAFHLEAPQEYLDRKKTLLADDTDSPDLINEELSDSMSLLRKS